MLEKSLRRLVIKLSLTILLYLLSAAVPVYCPVGGSHAAYATLHLSSSRSSSKSHSISSISSMGSLSLACSFKIKPPLLPPVSFLLSLFSLADIIAGSEFKFYTGGLPSSPLSSLIIFPRSASLIRVCGVYYVIVPFLRLISYVSGLRPPIPPLNESSLAGSVTLWMVSPL